MPDLIAGKYEVLETVGRGGMGTVYKARQLNLDRIVAIKMLSEELASDPEFRARFQQEATVVARLNHPNIVQVHDIEAHKNTFCIIMEFVDGENLQQKIDRDVTLPETEVMAIGAQVGRALAYAHTRGIIHRDIKPDNIHVTPKGIAKVMDFGIARFMDSKLKTQTGISMGTPKFMSPEQVTGKNVDGQTDLYSLGVCLYYCLSGRPPFDGENAISVATRHLYEQPEPPSKINPSISPAVESAVLKALEKQKANRYKTGLEMADALEASIGMKPSARQGTDADELAGNGATLKMPSQTYSPTPEAVAAAYSTPADVSNVSSGGTSPSMRVPATPANPAGNTSPHQVPELDSGFRTPNSADPTEPQRNFQRALLVFGGLVLLAVALLVVLVMWLRTSDSNLLSGGEIMPRELSPVERLQRVDSEADRLLAENRSTDARQLWLDFRKQHPDTEPGRVAAEIQEIEARLPLSEAQVLAERRYQEAFSALNDQNRALAFAYLKAAIALSPELADSAVTTSTLQNLERKLSIDPAPAAVESAEQALATALARMQEGKLDADTQKLLVQAVETDYKAAAAWEALGDFFLESKNVDSARVMYGEAIMLAGNVEHQVRVRSKLAKISA